MKKIFFILIPLILFCSFAVSTLFSQGNMQKLTANKEKSFKRNQKNNASHNNTEHNNQSFNCKTCHANEYPTKNDPGLRSCPRNNMITDFPSSIEGPEIVVIDEMSENYTGVIFSHRIHSQMSEMSTGCGDCHHYNTSGPVLNCRECHEKNRTREDVSVPDLKAAYHRQCLTCHKEWSHENGCSSLCHLRKTPENEKLIKKDYSGKVHPKRTEPTKMKWETNYAEGNIVTFFHNEHNKLFNLNCSDCHRNDKCIKCHEKQKPLIDINKPSQIKKSFEEQHKLCLNCHKGNACQKCHSDNETLPFNHGKSSGWVLKSYHSQLTCTKCHGNQMPFKKLDRNCKSCHNNFIMGKFDHMKTGLILSENHKELECNNCHTNDDFTKSPECKMCHDDKSHPAHSPGKRSKR
ncbi:MAG: cytochrome c3 family protein [Ignavibacteriae bacterium]|nr:cytochrome c3 family protein [Ignavibacteriota bacterium]